MSMFYLMEMYAHETQFNNCTQNSSKHLIHGGFLTWEPKPVEGMTFLFSYTKLLG